MKKPSLLAAAIATALVTSGCEQSTPPGTASAPVTPASPAATAPSLGESIATVNGKAISKAELASLTEEITARGMGDRVTQAQLLDELIKRELLRQDAEAKHLASTPDIAARLANIQRAVLAHAAGQAFIKANPITDEMIKQEYDRQTATKSSEYKARHILVKSEQEAKDVIAKLQAGGKFEDLAKKLSGDPGSASKGGDLGWFSPQQMVGPFADAVVKLENGKYTTEPVKSDFGWHVILREQSREKTPPPLEAVKEQLSESLQNTAMQKYLADLQAKAAIVRNEVKAQEPAAEATKAKEGAEAASKPAAAEPAPAEAAKTEAKPAAATPAAPAATAKEAAKPAKDQAPAATEAEPHEHPANAPAHTH